MGGNGTHIDLLLRMLHKQIMVNWFKYLFRAQSLSKQQASTHAFKDQPQAPPPSLANSIIFKNLGNNCLDAGDWAGAENHFRQAIAINPDYADAHNNLGIALAEQHQYAEAVKHLKQAISLKPESFNSYYQLGAIADKLGNLDEAIQHLSQACSIKPDFAEAFEYLGLLLREQGRPEKSVECLRKAIAINPLLHTAHSSLLFALLNDEQLRQEALYAAHLKFAELFEAPVAHLVRPHTNDPDPDRRLKIGYVSPDFRRHSVAHFMMPVFANHDKKQVEIFCYYNFPEGDELTEQFAGIADNFIFCANMSDDQLAEKIRADGIDILVDLAGHTANNRLLVFARKPAPIQITYLGYVATTGLASMDYRLTNMDADPPENDCYYSEQLYRFKEHLWWAFRPASNLPVVTLLPALSNGFVTFCSINQIAKITLPMMNAWAEILRAVPDSRMIFMGIPEGIARKLIQEKFLSNGIETDRLVFYRFLPLDEYRNVLLQTDICLDTFPFNGGTTTCEALSLGLPVITMMGKPFVSRMGYALLKEIALLELVAISHKDYIKIAVELATNLERLSALRSGMRKRLAASSLSDERRFAQSLESAYREMWLKFALQKKGIHH
jgi:protein O-GlcNAc transferase